MKTISTLTKVRELFSILLFLISTSTVMGQITITHDDMPVPGTVMMRAIDTSSFTGPGGAGTNQIWDFSSASSHYADTIRFLNPAEVPGHELFPEANLAHVTTVYDEMGTIHIQGFEYSAIDGIFELGGNAYFISPGFSFLEFHSFNPAPNLLPLPFSYGNQAQSSTTGTSTTSVRFSDMLIDSTRIISHITANTTADGSGTLITPVGSYTTLRVQETSIHTDSTYTWNTVGGWEFVGVEMYETISYQWYANEIGNVAILTTDNETVEFQYLTSIIIDVPKIELASKMQIYPNPVSDKLYLLSDGKIKNVEIYSINGKLLISESASRVVDVSKLEPGIYICRGNNENAVTAVKFIKK